MRLCSHDLISGGFAVEVSVPLRPISQTTKSELGLHADENQTRLNIVEITCFWKQGHIRKLANVY